MLIYNNVEVDMKTLKAGCYLVNTENCTIGLIYRDNHNDYTFPKGHVEEGEDTISCAIRETAEETKRDAVIVVDIKPIEEHYTTSSQEECVCYMYVALDNGPSDNTSTDTHQLLWVDIDEVENKLSYESLKVSWAQIKPYIIDLLDKNSSMQTNKNT